VRLSLFAAAVAALFVWTSGGYLPTNIASHFDSSGTADSFMLRSSYLAVMISVVILVPLSTTFLGRWIMTLPEDLINLPNKSFWLAAERKEASLSYISNWIQWFSIGITMFFCYVHWLVVQANSYTPPQLDMLNIYTGLAAMLVALVIGIVLLMARFNRVTE